MSCSTYVKGRAGAQSPHQMLIKDVFQKLNCGRGVHRSNSQPLKKSLTGLFLLVLLILTTVLPAAALDDNTQNNPFYIPVLPAAAVNAKNPRQFQYFSQTGHSVSGAVLRFYRNTGGLERHGFPVSELVLFKNRYLQYFERSIIEFQPDYAGTDREITLLSLPYPDNGATLVTAFQSSPDKWYFPETGHSLTDQFLTFWRNNGGKESFGLPTSEPFLEVQPNGNKLTVQYFEDAKLEFHPENGDNYKVQIALTGLEAAKKDLQPYQLNPVPLARLTEPRTLRVPSLMFHYVRAVDQKKDLLGYNLSVNPDTFTKYLDWIKEKGFSTVTIKQLNDSLKYGVQLPENSINLRFDDGYASMWFAYTEMKKRGLTGTFFVVTRRLELLPEQWRQIDRDGFEVAAHTRTHPDLRGVKDLASEIMGSKQDLEAMLGHPVRTFAYPYGQLNANITKVVQNSGFDSAVSTVGGYNWTLTDLYKQPTVSVVGDDNLTSFSYKVFNGLPKNVAAAASTPAGATATPKK